MTGVNGLAQVSVEVGGESLAPLDARALEEVRVQQVLSLPTQCELAFVNPKGPLSQAIIPAGESLRVSVTGFSDPLFLGEITAAELSYQPSNGCEVRLRAYDKLHRLRKRRTVRVYVQTTARELATELVDGLQVTVTAAEDGPLFQTVIQHRESDLDLLIDVIERSGLYFTLRADVLHLLTLEGIADALSLTLRKELFEARIEVNGEPACRSVTVSAWDASHVQRHDGFAMTPRVGRKIAAEFPPAKFGLTGDLNVTAEMLEDNQQAQAIAQAALDVRVAREVSLSGVADGDPRLRPGSGVEIRGIAGQLSGTYILTAVTHTIRRRTGFVSEISTSPPPPRARARDTSAALGIVSRVDDPEALGRVRVALAAQGNLESDWLSVLSPGAGSGKGLVMLPDVGDQVVVLFANDFSQGMVLGSLYGIKHPPDMGVDNGSVRRYTLSTAGGQRVQFDDDNKKIRIDNSNGGFLEFSPDLLLLHSTTKLQIEAIGQPVVIRGNSIDFERT